MLTLEKIGQTLEFATTVLRASSATTTRSIIVDKCIDGFLKHAFFVALNNFWRIEINELLETVVAVDNAAIKIVKVGSGEATTGKRNHWA